MASAVGVGSKANSTLPLGRIEAQNGEIPVARFGHTTTYVGQFTVVLFGGAVGDLGRYQITNDTYTLDLARLKWSRTSADNTPSARAAHAAACVDSMQFVVYGGATGGGSLSSDELYLLDLRKTKMVWMTVPITGVTPCRRYGHSMLYLKPNLVVFGGNDGQKCRNDVWFMDVEKSPFSWTEVVLSDNAILPPPRVYQSAEVCKEGPATGMVVIFGGRTSDGRSLGDTWGLRQHRDGRWDWVAGPLKRGEHPLPRYQHAAAFVGSKMLIIGGRDTDVSRPLPTALYDTEVCEWRALPSASRFRHSTWRIDTMCYVYAGFNHKTQCQPVSDVISIDLPKYQNFYNDREINDSKRQANQQSMIATQSFNAPLTQGAPHQANMPYPSSPHAEHIFSQNRPTISPAVTKVTPGQVTMATKVHALQGQRNLDFSQMVSKIGLNELPEEGRKLSPYAPLTPLHQPDDDPFLVNIIGKLLRPNITFEEIDRDFNSNRSFCLSWDTVSALCNMVLPLIQAEEMVIRLRVPVKIYGDLHGQYYDMMQLFKAYNSPVDEDFPERNEFPSDSGIAGDIDSDAYLFLGDFVDRGTHSLEVICLLFALKCRYPNQFHLIRGNHEDGTINSVYGFKDECRRRLKEDTDHLESCWEKFNRVFEYLPLGAVVDDRVLCIHGGIGGSIHSIADIDELRRPLKVTQLPQTDVEQRVTDLLWSDPTDNDSIQGVLPNETRDPDGSGHIVKFGPDRVIDFLDRNHLDTIIRAHECVQDGFERFASGRLITIFSATDYCGTHQNAGALLFITRNLMMQPKVIYPPQRNMLQNSRATSWLEIDNSRPPTPPRSLQRIRDKELGFP